MKKYLNLLFCFFSSVFCLNANEGLKKAEQAYDQKQYKEAIANYEQLIKEGYTSYQLYYNLGNSYYKNSELGKAIYAYELARKIEPNDEDLKINLGIATSKTIDKIDTKENFFITAVKTNVLSSFSTGTWAGFSIISLLFACVCFFVFITSRASFLKRAFFTLTFLFFFGFILSYFLGYTALVSKSENKFAIVLEKEIKIMNEPTVAANIKFRLHEGTKIRVVENNGDWLLIKLENGNEGWLKAAEVGVI